MIRASLVLALTSIVCAAPRDDAAPRTTSGASASRTPANGRLGSVVSFGEDSQGELYICTTSGRVYRIVKRPGSPAA